MSEIQSLCRKWRNKDISLFAFQAELSTLIDQMTEATADVIAVRMLISLSE